MSEKKNNKELNQGLDNYLGNNPKDKPVQDECNGDKECMIKTDKGLVERINKTIVTEDGRQLLI